jgi:hypothetical protein
MRELFPEFYRPDKATLDKIWSSGIVVLDTNFLLALYRLPKEGQEDLFKSLEAIQERIWVPHHVALEYQRNRLNVVADQKNLVHTMTVHIDDTFNDFKKGLASHKRFQPEKVIDRMSSVLEEYKNELAKLALGQADVHDEDAIRQRIDGLLEKRVGAPFDQAKITSIDKDGDIRFANSIPPGYQDVSKKGSFVNAGIIYQQRFGDLYLWKQLLEHVAANRGSSVILLTNDNKDDWWTKNRGKTIGPHTELIAECLSAGAAQFHMYTLPHFLEIAENRFAADVRKEAIEQANDLNTEDTLLAQGRGVLKPVVSVICERALSSEDMKYIGLLVNALSGLECAIDGTRITAYLPPTKPEIDFKRLKKTLRGIAGVVQVVDLSAQHSPSIPNRQKRLRVVLDEEAPLMFTSDRVAAICESLLGSSCEVVWDGGDLAVVPPEGFNQWDYLRSAVMSIPQVNNAVVFETYAGPN